MEEHARLEPIHLLRTKLYRPRTTGELVPRQRLFAVFDRYLERPATLVCAPAGYGKTTAISLWLENCQCPSAWLSLDPGDSNVAVFVAYFVAAVRTVFPDACPKTLALLGAPAMPPLSALVTTLSNDLESLADEPTLRDGRRLVLVLDDYHTIDNEAVHALVGELLRHPPRTLHLVLSARHDPPLPLARLRSQGQLSEMRVTDLRFSREESLAFAARTLTTPLPADGLTALMDMTEGWGTGLRLAALALNAGGELPGEHDLATFRIQYALDFLLQEVLSRVPAVTQRFLLETSILDRLSGPLCDALVDLHDSTWDGRAYLEWLSGQSVFTLALDAEGQWYRYHNLFRKLLRRELERHYSGETVAELRSRASAWFEQHGFIEEAIQYALAAGDEPAAVRVLEGYRHEAMNRENWRQLERWLGLMPRSLVDTRPELLTLEAWLMEKQWRYAELASHLDRIEKLICAGPATEADCARLRGELEALRCVALYFLLDFERASACARRALELLPAGYSAARSLAWMYIPAAALAAGETAKARELLLEGLREDRAHGNAFASRVYAGLCIVAWLSGEMPQLRLTATRMLQVSEERGLLEMGTFARYYIGCALYQMNDLHGAEQEFLSVTQSRYLTHGHHYTQSIFGLASVYAARGEMARAQTVVEAAASYGLETASNRVLFDAQAVRLCLLHRDGGSLEVQAWQETYDPEAPLAPMATFVHPHILMARILVDSASAVPREKAARILERLREFAARTHNIRYLVEVLALQAVLREAQGRREHALEELTEALALAEPGELIRVFVDTGPQVAALLRLLLAAPMRRGGHARIAFIGKILAAFNEPHHAVPRANQTALIEPLTNRELEVLELLRERLMHKEIGQQLDISPLTVKRHANNIYEKLGVGNRREAVDKAETLGLLPPTVRLRHQ
jgi:LuxR family maltose regulon positive regulatory protein